VAPQAPQDPLTGLSASRFGLYIHFPYCLSKCPYCDFASTVAKEVPEQRYANAVLAELDLRLAAAPELTDRPLESIYIGGGTPSLWNPRYVAVILEVVRGRFSLTSGAEVTLEANPGAADARRFEGFRNAGINRLSIGVQSFHPTTLTALGRTHDPDTAVQAFAAARAGGFENVSMDFIYGAPGQLLESAVADAERAASLGPEHLSAYALTLDRESLAEEVPLAKQLARGELALPSDEQTVEMAHAIQAVYAAADFERYETSNYARAGFHSRHNALYWTGGEYLALGTGATGFIRRSSEAVRYSNHRSAERYLVEIEAGRPPEASQEILHPRELFEERLAMGLRLSRGIDVRAVCESFGEPFAKREAELDRLVTAGFAQRSDRRIALTSRGADLHSSICARLI
jgi:putative oxygen-independent coproporphyrinogen III oxidase